MGVKKIILGTGSALFSVFLLATLFTGCTAGTSYSETSELTLSAEGLRRLEIRTGQGDVGIRGVAEGSDITVNAEVVVSGKDNKNIREIIDDQLVLTLEKRSSAAVFQGYFEQPMFPVSLFTQQKRSVHVDIAVPLSLAVHIQDDDGDLYISGLRNGVDIVDEAGDIVVENVAGSVHIQDNAGSMMMTSIDGSLDIDDKSGDIEIENCRGTFEITDTNEAVRISNSQGPVHLTDTSGEIIIEDHSGDIELQARNRGNVTLKGVSGTVTQNY